MSRIPTYQENEFIKVIDTLNTDFKKKIKIELKIINLEGIEQ